MSYNRKFEDSYLDQEQEEIDELMKTANADTADSIGACLKLMEIAEKTGNKDLYYRASEKMASL